VTGSVAKSRGLGLFLGAAVLAIILGPGSLRAQEGGVGGAVEVAQAAWLAHDVGALMSGADTVRLRIPDVAPSASLRPGQAARLLERYLKPTREVAFDLHEIRELAPDHAYAEMGRVYVVEGTDEERSETVFLGFRKIDGHWRLREVRVMP
jgi:hypothetical protein